MLISFQGGIMEYTDFLDENTLRQWCVRIEAREDMVEVLCAVARRVAKDNFLQAFFAAEVERHAAQNQWHRLWSPLPMDENITGAFEEPSQFYYLTYLAVLPWTLRRYEQMGISVEIFDDTMRQLPFLFLEKHDAIGRWQYTGFGWIWRHLSAELFRLGRMQFILETFQRGESFFRNKENGEVVVLCDPTLPLREDGWANGAGGRTQEPPWYGVCQRVDGGWQGNTVGHEGRVLPEIVTLDDARWEPALSPGDAVLELHIPKDGDFSPQSCRESLAFAERFYGQYFPQARYKGLYCHTWLFTAQLQQFLKPGSHILAFRDEFHRLPVAGSESFLWNFVFGLAYNRENAPRDTSLRRAVLDHLQAGGEIFDLSGVALHGSGQWGRK